MVATKPMMAKTHIFFTGNSQELVSRGGTVAGNFLFLLFYHFLLNQTKFGFLRFSSFEQNSTGISILVLVFTLAILLPAFVNIVM